MPQITSALEADETMIQNLRTEAERRLQAGGKANDDLFAICHLIFDILSLQDKIKSSSRTTNCKKG